MEKRYYIFLIAMIAFVVAISGCTSLNTDSDTNSDTDIGTSDEATWHSVANFSGTDEEKTSTFTIKGNKLKVNATATAEDNATPKYAALYFNVYAEGESMYEEVCSLEEFNQTTETEEFEVNVTPGKYYLNLYPANLANWKVEVFDYY